MLTITEQRSDGTVLDRRMYEDHAAVRKFMKHEREWSHATEFYLKDEEQQTVELVRVVKDAIVSFDGHLIWKDAP